MNNIILASKSKVRKNILNSNGITCKVIPSNVDEDSIKISLMKENATPEIISKNLAELKANKVSSQFINDLVIGADGAAQLIEVNSRPWGRVKALARRWPERFKHAHDVACERPLMYLSWRLLHGNKMA